MQMNDFHRFNREKYSITIHRHYKRAILRLLPYLYYYRSVYFFNLSFFFFSLLYPFFSWCKIFAILNLPRHLVQHSILVFRTKRRAFSCCSLRFPEFSVLLLYVIYTSICISRKACAREFRLTEGNDFSPILYFYQQVCSIVGF